MGATEQPLMMRGLVLAQAAALAVREYPLLNASLAPDGSAIAQHNTVNLGIAMATPCELLWGA